MYRKGLLDIYDRMRRKEPKGKPYVVWLAGPTGCGKTMLAFNSANKDDIWMSSRLPWANGYSG